MFNFRLTVAAIAINLLLTAGCAQPLTGIVAAESPDGAVQVLSAKDGQISHESGMFHASVVRNDDVLVVVDFWADWCGPCKMLASELEKTQLEFGDKVSVVKVDVDANPALAKHFSLSAIPRLVVFRSGRSVADIEGFVSAGELGERLNQLQ